MACVALDMRLRTGEDRRVPRRVTPLPRACWAGVDDLGQYPVPLALRTNGYAQDHTGPPNIDPA